jgi:hypothetical protein
MFGRSLLAIAVVFATGFAGSLLDVVSTSGILATEGRGPLLALWTFDALIALLAAGAVVNFIDRFDRLQLVQRIAWIYVASSLTFATLLRSFASAGWPFVVAAVGERMINVVVYAAAWALTRDVCGSDPWALSRARLAASVGILLGAVTAAATGAYHVQPYALFGAVAAIFLFVALVLSRAAARARSAPAPDERAEVAVSIVPPFRAFQSLRPSVPVESASPRTGVRRAMADLRDSRGVRLVALIGALNGVAFTALAYELAMLVGDGVAGDVQARYGTLRTFEFFAHTFGDMVLAPLAIRRWGFAPAMGLTPTVLVLGLGLLFRFRSLALGMAASSLLQFAFSFEAIAVATAVATAPRSTRGRVGVMLDTTPYQFGYIAASATLAALLLAERLGIPSQSCRRAGLAVGLAAAVISGWCALALTRKLRRESSAI